jgi:hypothetical protein
LVQSLPPSILEINKLPDAEKTAIYKQLIPPWVFTDYEIDPEAFMKAGVQVVRFRCPLGSRSVEITVRYHPYELDPLLYLHMIDTFNHQLMVLLLVVNDPLSPRYNVDRDLEGHDTQFGTQSRNLPEEIRAMQDDMAPGQIRRGLRSFRRGVPIFEDFVARMGHDLFQIEPLFYHNAIIFERYGFAYTYGRREMEAIHQAFQPGGALYQRLDGSTPFRSQDAWQTVRKRSWAIHDGILGHPFTGFQMYKRIGVDAGINTFPDSIW